MKPKPHPKPRKPRARYQVARWNGSFPWVVFDKKLNHVLAAYDTRWEAESYLDQIK